MEPPAEFPFPFTPYDIQKEFMRNLYLALDNRKVGIFESPTGTGKSMSIICSSLTWLRDFEKNRRKELEEKLSSQTSECDADQEEEVDWIAEYIQKQDVNSGRSEAQDALLKLKSRDEKIKRTLERKDDSFMEPRKKRLKYESRAKDKTLALMELAKIELDNQDNNSSKDMISEVHDLDLLLDDYQSDDENKCPFDDDMEENDDLGSVVQKIYYCSRTHSQLTQFIRELQKSPFNNETDMDFFLTVAPLASRQSLCINPAVRKLGSVQQMNDKCLDLQKNSSKEQDEESSNKKKKSSCPYKTLNGIEYLSGTLIQKIHDIEDAVKNGKEAYACPYYATRQAVPLAQLIVIPYQILLHEKTRKASGIQLKDSVVIVDEAHNLVDTISNIHSVEVSCSQVLKAHNQLTQYVKKYIKRLKAENLMYVKRILYILKKLLEVMGIEKANQAAQDPSLKQQSKKLLTKTTLMKINDFLFKANLDNLNLFKVLRYCERSMISRKLNGFVEKYASEGEVVTLRERSSLSKFIAAVVKDQENEELSTPISNSSAPVMRSPLMHIENFLLSLTSSNDDGRIAITTLKQESGRTQSQIQNAASIKFLLLNPASHFKDIVEECRAIIVAGGTMQPSSSFVNQLLTPLGVPKDRIFEFSCGHVIDKNQLLPVVLTHGPSRVEFEFTFEKRKDLKLIDELGRSVSNFCNIVPGGVVCFFPSYDYEAVIFSRWSDTGVLEKIETKKKIFRESRKGGQVDTVLKDYSTCVQRTKSSKTGLTGALLLSVVGGKVSEGINFSDDLGRCIIMVGLPYPNLYSAELKEKMAYLDQNMPKVGSKSAGQSYYENLCMKAVNQSIGRAIRHRNDYASIILVDKRYKRSDIHSQLPGWISDKFIPTDGFGSTFGAIRKFFLNKKE